MQSFSQFIVEDKNTSGPKHADENVHRHLIKDGLVHRVIGKDVDHYSTEEETSPKYLHDILTKHGYYPITQSKADSRVKLPKYTYYEKPGAYSDRRAHIHHKNGDASAVTFHTARDNS